jgi:hypothetical protein
MADLFLARSLLPPLVILCVLSIFKMTGGEGREVSNGRSYGSGSVYCRSCSGGVRERGIGRRSWSATHPSPTCHSTIPTSSYEHDELRHPSHRLTVQCGNVEVMGQHQLMIHLVDGAAPPPRTSWFDPILGALVSWT